LAAVIYKFRVSRGAVLTSGNELLNFFSL